MRVTTQMLNQSAGRAGLPMNRASLLNYVNGGRSNSNALLNALQSKASVKMGPADRVKYEKLEKSAGQLESLAAKFVAEGEKSLFGKASATGDAVEVYGEIDNLVSTYNSTLSILESLSGTMNNFYLQNLRDLAADHKDSLADIGISVDKQRKMQLDREKLEAADLEKVEKVLGKEGKFSSKLSFLAGRVENNVESNMTSASGGYSAKGDITGMYFNRYDYRG